MKAGFKVLMLLMIMSYTVVQVAWADEPTVGKVEFTHTTGEDVLIDLQGENTDLWIVSFYQPEDNYEEVREQIEEAMTRTHPDDTYQYGEVSLTSGYEYQDLFETLDMIGEPKRGHTTPQVLIMKNGEGYVVYGPDIGNGVAKKFIEVRDGKVMSGGS